MDGRKLSAALTTPPAVTSAFAESDVPLNLKLAVSIIFMPTLIIPLGFEAVTKPVILCANCGVNSILLITADKIPPEYKYVTVRERLCESRILPISNPLLP